MAEIIGVRFKEVGKVYYFDPIGNKLNVGDKVIVETTRGVECGTVALQNKEVSDDNIVHPLKQIIRIASKEDIVQLNENKKKEKKAFAVCQRKIAELGLVMKLVDVEYTFDSKKIIFSFTSEGRVDFRALVKELASIFKTRIELRQIGARDEAKKFGGLGVCGRPLCCNTYLGEFQPVSIKMAKEQGLSLNSLKISGNCGRLMCCLKYEQEAHADLLKTMPKVGAIVNTPNGEGKVVEANPLTRVLKVSLKKSPDAAPATYKCSDVKLIKDAKIKVDKKELEELKDLE